MILYYVESTEGKFSFSTYPIAEGELITRTITATDEQVQQIFDPAYIASVNDGEIIIEENTAYTDLRTAQATFLTDKAALKVLMEDRSADIDDIKDALALLL